MSALAEGQDGGSGGGESEAGGDGGRGGAGLQEQAAACGGQPSVPATAITAFLQHRQREGEKS